MKERKQFTKEFKQGATRLVIEQGGKERGSEAFRRQGQRTTEQQELYELRQRVRQLEEERAILKKAAACFARDIR